MSKAMFNCGDVVPKDVLRPEPDDGAWDIRFGQRVLVTRTKNGARVEVPPGEWPMDAPLCYVNRIDGAGPNVPTVLWGAPTDWVTPTTGEDKE